MKTVFSVTQNRLWNKESEDYFKVVLIFENGLVAQLDGSTSCRLTLPLWFIMGTKGTLVSENEDTKSEGIKIAAEVDGKIETYRPKVIPSNWTSFYDNFPQAYRGTTDLAIPPQEGREVVRVLEAAYKSSETAEVVSF